MGGRTDHLEHNWLERYADGDVNEADRAAIDAHLDVCPACRARLAGWESLFRTLRALPSFAPAQDFADQVMARVRVRPANGWLPVWARRGWAVTAAAVAAWAAALAVAAVWVFRQSEFTPEAALAWMGLQLRDAFWNAVLQVAGWAEVSGVIEWYKTASEAVPGPGLATAVAALTALSLVASWTLYKVNTTPLRARLHG